MSEFIFDLNSDLTEELGTNFIEYAVAVNTDRAIPDAKTGLKPVAKRIIYSAFEEGYVFKKPHVKCAKIVGDVMGNYHPHGDSSIYGALTRLSQDWVMRYPLIDWHGNKGNRDGDPPASYRYTEARLSKIAEDGLLGGIKKQVVDFEPNYDETRDEPITLPSLFPNLLCNPNTGIGVAAASNWLPHNLNEVANAIFDYMDGKEPILPGPDFPTGGIIINKDDIPMIMKTGHGSVKVRGKYTVEGNNIIFTEIPYGLLTEALMDDIKAKAKDGTIEGISTVKNSSTLKKGFRLVIECKKDANINRIISLLFAKTDLQTSISYNQVALVDKTPRELNLTDCIKIYVEHNLNCLTRELKFDLGKTQHKLEVTEGLLKALEDIDNIIALIKASKSGSDAEKQLMQTYNFTEAQAEAIVEMKLRRLAGLEKIELNEQRDELVKKIEELKALISNPESELRKRLTELVKTYGDNRRTELTQITEPKGEEKEIVNVPPEKCVVVLTEAGSIKRVPATAFKAQKRNGKGVKTQDEITSMVLRTNTIDNLLIFTNKGNMYRLLVNDIPEGNNTAKGVPVKALVSMEDGETPQVIYSIYRENVPSKYVFFVTKNGMVKKTALDEYLKTKKKTGIAAINLREGDSLASVFLMDEGSIILMTKNGYGIRFDSSEVSASGRVTVGLKGIALAEGDSVVCGLPVRDLNDQLAVFAPAGTAKKLSLKEVPLQKRAGKGLLYGKDGVAAVTLISDGDMVLVVGDKSSICIKAEEITTTETRTAIGTQILKGSRVIGVSKV